MNSNKLLFTIKEASEQLGLSRSVLYRMIQEDSVIHAVKIGGARRIPADELTSFVQYVKQQREISLPPV